MKSRFIMYVIMVDRLSRFVEHSRTVVDILDRALLCTVVKDRIWARDVIESIMLIVNDDHDIIGDSYLSDALYKAVMTCQCAENEFSDIRSTDAGSCSWYSILSSSSGVYTGDTLHVLKRLISESVNEPVKWNSGIRTNYFEIVGMYIHGKYHDGGQARPVRSHMMEYITRVLSSYSTRDNISSDYKESIITVLRMHIDKEHTIRLDQFTSELEMEYKIRMAIFTSDCPPDLSRKIFEVELEDELSDRKSLFQKQLSHERDARVSTFERNLDNSCSHSNNMLRALKNMTAIVLERIANSDSSDVSASK